MREDDIRRLAEALGPDVINLLGGRYTAYTKVRAACKRAGILHYQRQ